MKPLHTHATIKAQASPSQTGFRADRALCAMLGKLNRRAAKTLFHEGLVRLNGAVASGSERVNAGDTFEFPDPATHASENLIEKAKAPRLTTPHGRHLVRLYEDEDVLVVSKPAEIPVYRGQDGFTRRDTLEEVLTRAYPPRKFDARTAPLPSAQPAKKAASGPIRHPKRDDEEDEDSAPNPASTGPSQALQPGFYFVHRLDMETSGCLLIAKNHAAYEALTREFRERTIHKEYLAIVAGAVSWDEIVSTRPIKYVRGEAEKKYGAREDEPRRAQTPFYSLMRKQRSQAHNAAPKLGQKKGIALEEDSEEGKACETQFIALERYRGYSMIRAEPKTGRTHQIRVHLAALGHPLAYDPFYGKKSPYRMRDFDPSLGQSERGDEIVLSRLPLHAWKLGFTHPRTGKKIYIEAPPPRDFKEFARLLKKFRSFSNR